MRRGDLVLAPEGFWDESHLCLILEVGSHRIRVWNITVGIEEGYRREWADKNCEVLCEGG